VQDWDFKRRIAMAFQAYMSFKGTKQGTIKGSSTKGNHKGGIEIQDFSFGLESPVDVHSGGASGKRQHKPVVIVREVDAASPLLYQAMCNNEVFKSASLSFVRPSNQSGKHGSITNLELINGMIVSITHAPNSGGKRLERIIMDYEKYTVNGLSDVVVHSI
jgi:type VI secretion system secreted protein Hcp